ncbi:oligosaccharide flippase family protein [Methylobacterium sp. Leaf466]|uniref:lipopolysaccharide biosynthesis protein n=1 Tax=Methylobacterium sp. Leaf466 TaxID=1736386 RepID=UPI0006FA78CC|nr:oligosaccharide flippase family protein [Methylobacterium sp. Leaf466]KQT77377.1 polysaccharide biosynthesis protein [Methylobacterium sp. Leaf466]
MIARHTFTYVGSRGLAAALNMAAVAVFTRLAPPEAFGTYLLILSWSLLLYSATSQWPKYAFFALYDETRAAVQVGTVLRLLGGMVLLSGVVCAIACALGLVSGPVAVAVLASGAGMTLFEAAAEIARTRLAATAVAAAVVLRAVLVLGLGSLSLLVSGDARHLLLAIALANALAALPALAAIAPLLRGRGSLAEARAILAYGWPLIVSFTAAALAQTVDRLIVGGVLGTGALGAYGAVSDFLRQSFVVFGEAIALSLVSIAKRDARAGGMAAARPALADAMRLMALVAAFGAVFVLTFDGPIVSVLLGPDYRATALSVAPLLLAASILVMFRAYYFGQVIYFSPTSRLEAVASMVLLATVAGLSAVLIPRYGVAGAAVANLAGQAVACLVLVLGAREAVRLPIPWTDLMLIALGALACRLAVVGVDALALGPVGALLQLALIGLAAVATAWHLNPIGLADLVRSRIGRVS